MALELKCEDTKMSRQQKLDTIQKLIGKNSELRQQVLSDLTQDQEVTVKRDVFDILAVKDIKKCANNEILEELKKPFSLKRVAQIEQILNVVDVVKDSNISARLEEMLTVELNKIAATALKLIDTLQEKTSLVQIVAYFTPVVEKVSEICRQRDIEKFGEKQHAVDKSVKIPRVFLEHFERLTVKGDGNCVWHSASIALFGDYSASEALRLLTAATLVEFEREFRGRFDEQETKFGYKPDVTYDQLLATSTQLGVWGDEYHIVALSMAIRRPIYCYGRFDQFGSKAFDLPPGASADPYDIAMLIYEAVDTLGHFRYVGFEVDDDDCIEPVCIYYDGQFHYSVVLPRDTEKRVKPWKPKTQLLDYLVPKELSKSASSEDIAKRNGESVETVSENSVQPTSFNQDSTSALPEDISTKTEPVNSNREKTPSTADVAVGSSSTEPSVLATFYPDGNYSLICKKCDNVMSFCGKFEDTYRSALTEWYLCFICRCLGYFKVSERHVKEWLDKSRLHGTTLSGRFDGTKCRVDLPKINHKETAI